MVSCTLAGEMGLPRLLSEMWTSFIRKSRAARYKTMPKKQSKDNGDGGTVERFIKKDQGNVLQSSAAYIVKAKLLFSFV